MKYLLLLCDGMADLPVSSLGGKTPMDVAHKPNMDRLSSSSYCGMARTVPLSLPPGSDTANMSVMGYDPELYYTGRSPIEAISMGIDLGEDDVAFRVNLVTLSDDTSVYDRKKMIDYSSDEISTEEASELIKAIDAKFGESGFRFYAGRSYRHCLIWENGPVKGNLTPPHDILTKVISGYLPAEPAHKKLRDIMTSSHDILKDHPINLERINKGSNPANSIWIWGQGTKPEMPPISLSYGLKGSVISAVDLIFGLGICAGMTPVSVNGATGTIHTDFAGKADAAVAEFERGQDYVYLHIEAPDECGHRNEVENKVLSIELIDKIVLGPIYDHLENNRKKTGEDFRILIMPDHPTPLSLRTHTHEPVPFILYSSCESPLAPVSVYSEKECSRTGVFFEKAHLLFDYFIREGTEKS
ncbi:cofactor-independent phosphoglycerate mutase [Candidatus Nomurabacteria bacterium]|nr:cofactor-independent phosphoglycerate mutase [Candidatus Nomurabacteria bacterium]